MPISDMERRELRRLRAERGFSTRVLATRAHISNGTITNIENGHQTTLAYSKYVAYRRALSGDEGVALAEGTARRRNGLIRRIAKSASQLSDSQLAAVAGIIENMLREK